MAKKNIATFLGANKGLSIVGNHAYACSGGITVTNDSVECLNFTTGKETIMATFHFTTDYTTLANGKTAGFKINLNGVTIVELNDYISESYEGLTPKKIKFLIPPLTNVVTIGITNSTNVNLFYHTISAKVYA